MHPKIKILKGGLDFESERKAHLWHFAPRWPGSHPKAMRPEDLMAKIRCAHDLTYDGGHLVLWMPAAQLHKTKFDPLGMVVPWVPASTIISGISPISIGFVYSKSDPKTANWGCKLILDTCGRNGPNSSLTIKWLLEQLCTHGPVFDPWAHRSAQLAQWCRRFGIGYRGHIRGKENRASARKILAQIELPGIQTTLL
jgi:hypothetical protein